MSSMKKRLLDNKSPKYFILIFLALILVVCIAGATFAYFSLTVSDEDTITGNVGGSNLTLTVTKELPSTNPSNMIPQLESTLNEAINAPYNCIDDDNNVVCQVYKATITNSGSISTEVDGFISFQNIETLPNLKWRLMDSLTNLGVHNSLKAESTDYCFDQQKLLNPGESFDYYFVIWVDEIGIEQDDKGTFRATITFNARSGGITSPTTPEKATKKLMDLYNDGSTLTTVHIGGDSTKPTVSQNATQGIMLDNNGEYRYYGANPNNYVTFNGELWRIISVSNVKSSTTDTTGAMRMKIIRNTNLGNYSWDSSLSTINTGYGVNDWTQADLKTELNNLYYNQQSGTCYNGQNNASTTCNFTTTGLSPDAKNMIGEALWYLGSSSSGNEKYANDYYTTERGTMTYGCSVDDGACPRATTWTGHVGLMYLSDYVYATDPTLCTANILYWSQSTNSSCKTNDWLYDSSNNQWTMFPFAGKASGVFFVTLSGSVDGSYNAYRAFGVRPVVVLQSDVKITDGDGSEENPYQLGIE